MRLRKGDGGLFFTLPMELADRIGLAEGNDVTVRATADGRMERVRARKGAMKEGVATFDACRRGQGASSP